MDEITEIQLDKLIAPSFYRIHNDIQQHRHTHYWENGGRGSTKSSFISLEIILLMHQHSRMNAVVVRKMGTELQNSVYAQILWAIETLGMSQLWKAYISPLKMVNQRTGQVILFRGLDEATKTKSIKFKRGYCGVVWYEELDQFDGMEEIRKANQSFIRGGEKYFVFYSYNPPKSINSWVNIEAQITRPDRRVHHSTYLDVPREWLGEQFIIEADILKATNPDAYEHEYLGKVTGTGGEVFRNVRLEKLSDEKIKTFEVVRRGLDFGFAVDPLHYTAVAYERKYKRLYIYHEVHAISMSNRTAYAEIAKENTNNGLVYADSAEPKSISELQQYGLRIARAIKGPDSVEYGIKFLQDLNEIIIDEERCPNTAREFLNYELEKDVHGNFKAGYPDKDNHSIDAVRYALNVECLKHRSEAKKKPQPIYNFPSERPKQNPFAIQPTEAFFKGGYDV